MESRVAAIGDSIPGSGTRALRHLGEAFTRPDDGSRKHFDQEKFVRGMSRPGTSSSSALCKCRRSLTVGCMNGGERGYGSRDLHRILDELTPL